jgi:SAM-dependent methyltransferase
MIALLASRARDAGLGASVTTWLGDGHALPFADGSFDAAFSIFGLMFFADRARGASELGRVVRPGGFAVVGSWAPLEQVPAIAALFAALRRAAPELAIPPMAAPLGHPDEVRVLFGDAGLRDVVVHSVEHALVYGSAAELWSSFALSAAPIALVRERVGAQRFAAISAAVVDELSARLGDGSVRVAMTAHLGVGVR